jgi:hypothetical protein
MNRNMVEYDTRLRELSSKAVDGDITDEELAEMAQLSRAKKSLREKRANMIAGLQETLQLHGVTIQDLFSTSEINAAAQFTNASVRLTGESARRGIRAMTALKRERVSGSGTWVRKKTGLVLIEVVRDGQNGFPCRYCKGQLLPYYVAKGWKALDDGQLEANLERFYTAQGKEYFSTDAGRVELAQLANYIRTHNLKPPPK